jgi:hypothetical protein
MGKNVCSFPVLVVSLSAKKPDEHPFQRSDTRFTKEVRENFGKIRLFLGRRSQCRLLTLPAIRNRGLAGRVQSHKPL